MSRQDGAVLHHVDTSFWEYVEKMDDGRMVCKFCGHGFAKDTAITRIKLHLAEVTGRGVKICGKVPQDVQEAALAAVPIDGPPEKKHKTRAGPSNNEVTNAAQQQNNEMEPLERGSFHERPSFNQADEPRGDPSQPTNDQFCSPSVNNDVNVNDAQNIVGVRTEQNNEVDNVPVVDTMAHTPGRSVEEYMRSLEACLLEDSIDNGTRGVAQPGAGASSSGGLRHNPSETRGAPLLTGSTRLVGQAFEENKNVIWSWLTNDEVSTIGIYGMGGAGKTTMLKHINNELLQSPDIPHYVYWVTVSQDFSVPKLQNNIAKHIQLSFSNEEEELGQRAAELSRELMKKQIWILILDDLWKSFELDKVGIPASLKGCKLIMTTRSEAVCLQMNSKNILDDGLD